MITVLVVVPVQGSLKHKTTIIAWYSFCTSMSILIVHLVMRFTLYSVQTVVNFGAFIDNSTVHFLVVVKAGAYVVLSTANVTLVHFAHFIMSFYMCIKTVSGVKLFSTFYTSVGGMCTFVQMGPIN